jgi:hypothetical protein
MNICMKTAGSRGAAAAASGAEGWAGAFSPWGLMGTIIIQGFHMGWAPGWGWG